jgi:UDP-2-acetamido-2,6-beta-L-arabino-hexul-4-ose reductase
MKILVTGAKGFIGKNLIAQLRNKNYKDILEYDLETEKSLLNEYIRECDFVYHLAGANRPKDEKEYMEGNYGLTYELLGLLKKYNNKATVLFTSSIQAEKDNPYGRSKRAGEELLFTYGAENNVRVYIYRLSNIFGKWSRPNYNTVVATYCHNITRDMDIQVSNPDTNLELCYIDDVVEEFINGMKGKPTMEDRYCYVPQLYHIKLGELAEKIRGFKDSRENLNVPDMGDELTKKLYSTYLSFLPIDSFSYELKVNRDHRGSFTEFIRTLDRGQVSVNISKPGIIKGNHWHHSKNEKFLVVSGTGLIRFRKVGSDEIIEYRVSEDKFEVVDIPAGYAHSIVNTGDSDLVTIMWANECHDPEKPDTYYMEV